jgi:hypothetical protein
MELKEALGKQQEQLLALQQTMESEKELVKMRLNEMRKLEFEQLEMK